MDIIKNEINDILDCKGIHLNFITGEPYSEEYKKLANQWSVLPLYQNKQSTKKFFDLLDTNQIILLDSHTGSGKTLLVPKYVLKYNKILNIDSKIAITNAKILTTISNAEYSAKIADVQLGKEIGCKFKGSSKELISDESQLLYVTDGLLLAKILSGNKLLSEYNCVIIDEAHERGIQIDLLLKFLKEIVLSRPEFKIIIMSATINSEIFRNYFSKGNFKYGEIEISGQTNFAIKKIFLDDKDAKKVNRSTYLNAAVDKCINILDTTEDGDILIFIATANDAIKGCKLLNDECPQKLVLKKNKKNFCDSVYCVEVYSKMKQENKELAVSKDLYKTKYINKNRKVIFTTNIAESSITFDGLVYVIDSGYELIKYYEPLKNGIIINKVYTSQAQILQRIGRCGRTQPGTAYHLYTQFVYNNLKKYPDPDILTIDLTEYMLGFIKYSKTINDTINIIQDLITVPYIEQFIATLYKLHFIDAIKIVDLDNKIIDKIDWLSIKSYEDFYKNMNGALTTLGYILLRFRSVPLLDALAIIMSYYMECQEEMIKLVAIISICEGNIDSLFDYNIDNKKYFIKDLIKYSIAGSDHLTILNIYNKYYLEEKKNKYLNIKKFNKIDEYIIELTKYTKSIKPKKYDYINEKYNIIKIKEVKNKIIYVLKCAYRFNILNNKKKEIYKSINYLENVNANLEFSIITKKVLTKNVICTFYNEIFGRSNFKIISII